jgi:hypothetical protein
MIRTFAIAIAAVLYVLAVVGHAHHASADHAQAPLGSVKH